MDLNDIINYRRPKESYYDILGCSQTSDVDQINKEYKIKALQYHPDKNSDPQSKDKFMALQNAKDILTDRTTRKLYDAWLSSGINVPFEQFRNSRSHTFHWAAPRQTGKLSIQSQDRQNHNRNQGDGSDTKGAASGQSFLERFRKYEI